MGSLEFYKRDEREVTVKPNTERVDPDAQTYGTMKLLGNRLNTLEQVAKISPSAAEYKSDVAVTKKTVEVFGHAVITTKKMPVAPIAASPMESNIRSKATEESKNDENNSDEGNSASYTR